MRHDDLVDFGVTDEKDFSGQIGYDIERVTQNQERKKENLQLFSYPYYIFLLSMSDKSKNYLRVKF